MKKIIIVLTIIAALAGCNHTSLRDQVLQTPNGAAHVKECDDIAATITKAEADREGWTLDECYKAFL